MKLRTLKKNFKLPPPTQQSTPVQGALVVKFLPAYAGDVRHLGSIPGSGRSPWRRAWHSRILAWRIPWTEEPGGRQSMGLQRVRHD